jgi:hypothetical protein
MLKELFYFMPGGRIGFNSDVVYHFPAGQTKGTGFHVKSKEWMIPRFWHRDEMRRNKRDGWLPKKLSRKAAMTIIEDRLNH